MHTVVRLLPLPVCNALFGGALAVAYMDAAGEAVDAPYGVMVDLARDIDAGRADVDDMADRIRSWRDLAVRSGGGAARWPATALRSSVVSPPNGPTSDISHTWTICTGHLRIWPRGMRPSP